MALRKLTPVEVEQSKSEVPAWDVRDDSLYREFVFGDFVAAFGFMTQVAILAEAMNHHPDWSNVYSTVRIGLSTHDVGGLSSSDFQLAAKIDALAPADSGAAS
jgi:4a-hydroxytetrahydrobiopterin dehydratase